jgi:hypothetical protein
MTGQTASQKPTTTVFDAKLSARMLALVTRAAGMPDVKEAVEANHDNNRWWPLTITDPRMRMLAAGWSTRVNYKMVGTYAAVLAEADRLGFDKLATLDDDELGKVVHPLGLKASRIAYLRSLAEFVEKLDAEGVEVATMPGDDLIARIAGEVDQASFKVGQCAALFVGGYHCGIIPVDSGMVDKLAPVLGINLPSGPIAHETMRRLLQGCVNDRPGDYRWIIDDLDYQVSIARGVIPTWWAHLVLIYFKRAHLNRAEPRLCPKRPVCSAVLDCEHLAG